jgi:hypothetical protein
MSRRQSIKKAGGGINKQFKTIDLSSENLPLILNPKD